MHRTDGPFLPPIRTVAHSYRKVTHPPPTRSPPHLGVVYGGAVCRGGAHRYIFKQAHRVDGIDVAAPLAQAEHLQEGRKARGTAGMRA